MYSSALKLQFRECLDEELFQAYVRDWKNAKQAARVRAWSLAKHEDVHPFGSLTEPVLVCLVVWFLLGKQTVASSAAFRASTERVEGLKTQILRLDRAVHMRWAVSSKRRAVAESWVVGWCCLASLARVR